MRRIAITGISGDVGHRVARRLLDAGHQVVGVDLQPPSRLADVIDFRRADIRDRDALRDAFAGCDVIIHLAFLIDQTVDISFMRDVNIRGTQSVFEIAAELGVGHVVYTSSASAYGATAGNDVPLKEESPLLAEELLYAGQKAEIERWLEEFQAAEPRLSITVLRPAIVLGAGVENFIIRTFAGPRMVVVAEHRPPLQFVHADDLTAAIAHVTDTGVTGAYNVASEGWLSMVEVAAILDRRFLQLGEEVIRDLARRAASLGFLDLPTGAIDYLIHPWVVSIDKLVATGWQPTYSNRDAVGALAEEIRDRIVVGPLDVSRDLVRRTGLATGAATLLTAGVAAWSWWRRRRAS